MNEDLPEFKDAVEDFCAFLRKEGHSDKLLWVFRDDLWFRGIDRITIRLPVDIENESLIRKVYDDGRSKGLICLYALATFRSQTVATMWFPKFEEEEVQGWGIGVKLSIRIPLMETSSVRSMFWGLITKLPSYRESFRRNASWIGSQEWARS